MALTVKEINAHIDHYQIYRELPVEVMHELFASALVVGGLNAPKEFVEAAVEAGAMEPAPAKRVPRSKQA